MKTITRRIARLEDRFASRIAMPDGWAKEELLKRLEGMRTRLFLGEPDLEGDAADAAHQQVKEWLSDWRQRQDGRA